MKKIILLIVAAVCVFAVYRVISSQSGAGGGMAGMMGPMPVDVAEVTAREVVLWDEFSGRLEAVDKVVVTPRVSGTVDDIHFEEGQMVGKGQPLFTIDQKPFAANLKAAVALADYTSAEFTRAQTLLPEGAISKREYDEKRNAAAAASAALTRAQLDLGYTTIRAPIAGRISRAEITVGNLVKAEASPVLTSIVALNPIYASFDVDEQSYVRYLRASGGNVHDLKKVPVRLALSGEKNFETEGRIAAFDNELNTRSGTVRVRAVFQNKSGLLLPGLFARVQVGGAGKEFALLVPEKAVATDQNRKMVFVVNAENKVEPRVVALGPVVEGMRVVREGLKEGEKIIVNGLQRARPGAEVIPQMVGADGKPLATAEPVP
jgi:membrane fusion protein, multidrug efflux system